MPSLMVESRFNVSNMTHHILMGETGLGSDTRWPPFVPCGAIKMTTSVDEPIFVNHFKKLIFLKIYCLKLFPVYNHIVVSIIQTKWIKWMVLTFLWFKVLLLDIDVGTPKCVHRLTFRPCKSKKLFNNVSHIYLDYRNGYIAVGCNNQIWHKFNVWVHQDHFKHFF